MSRENPLEPLEQDVKERAAKQERIRRFARISISWFVGFMMVSALLRYMVRYIQ